jgi:hypothetical protein
MACRRGNGQPWPAPSAGSDGGMTAGHAHFSLAARFHELHLLSQSTLSGKRFGDLRDTAAEFARHPAKRRKIWHWNVPAGYSRKHRFA